MLFEKYKLIFSFYASTMHLCKGWMQILKILWEDFGEELGFQDIFRKGKENA